VNPHPVTLDAADAAELAEMLEFLAAFPGGHDHQITPALSQFASGYSVADLRADLARFAFLLGATDEQLIFGSGEEP